MAPLHVLPVDAGRPVSSQAAIPAMRARPNPAGGCRIAFASDDEEKPFKRQPTAIRAPPGTLIFVHVLVADSPHPLHYRHATAPARPCPVARRFRDGVRIYEPGTLAGDDVRAGAWISAFARYVRADGRARPSPRDDGRHRPRCTHRRSRSSRHAQRAGNLPWDGLFHRRSADDDRRAGFGFRAARAARTCPCAGDGACVA
jgi:hypothetical protein